LYEWIAENELHCVDWSKVILIWGDERMVSHDSPESNYRMVRQAWLDPALQTKEPRCSPQVYPVPIYANAPERSAREYCKTLEKVLTSSNSSLNETSDPATKIPRIDLVLLGLGDDSHTASLFPETQALAATDELFVANFIPKFGSYRLTMTVPLINAARSVAFLVCGASKQAAVDVVWHGPRQGDQYPAQSIQPEPGELLWFLDTAAVPEHRRADYQP
jgi:6-phosphogluconolactonase